MKSSLNLRKIMKLSRVVLFTVLSLAFNSWAEVFTLDPCRFRGESNKQIFLELYTSLNRDMVTYREDSSGWFGAVNFRVEIGHGGTPIAIEQWRVDDEISDIKNLKQGQKLVDVRTYTIAPGEYEIIATATDSISSKIWKTTKALTIASFPYTDLLLSDIELAGYLIPPGVMEKFDRGDYGLVPNPDRTFGKTRPFFYYYVEVYPALDTLTASAYTLERRILDYTGFAVKTLPSVPFNAGPEPFADVDSVSIENIATGTYTFELKISNERGQEFTRQRKFFVLSDEFYEKPVTRTLDSLEIEKELDEVEFLLKRDKFRLPDSVTIAEKADFLDEFWRQYDDGSDSRDGVARLRFKARIEEVNSRWTTSRNPGYRTDRGRVYVLYGEPDSRETHPYDIHAKPYEIWNYDKLEGGVIFVFIDRSNLNEYFLAHSSKPGEVFNPNWYQDYVERSGMDSGR